MPSLFVILADRAGLQAVLAAAICAPLSLQVPDVSTAGVRCANTPSAAGPYFCARRGLVGFSRFLSELGAARGRGSDNRSFTEATCV